MWYESISPLCDLLQCRLPNSSDHLEWFLSKAYAGYTALWETAARDSSLVHTPPTLQASWSMQLGDLSRFRLAMGLGSDEQDSWKKTAQLGIYRRMIFIQLQEYYIIALV